MIFVALKSKLLYNEFEQRKYTKIMEQKTKKLFTNEIVWRGHPDKVCDQISGAILDELLRQDKGSRVGIETAIKNNKIFIFGEITSNAKVDYVEVARRVVRDIGYTEDYDVITEISEQSRDIALGTNNEVGGAGDQGMMFGYACNDTDCLLPTAMVILQRLAKWYDVLLHSLDFPYHNWLRPDGKAQITGIYDADFRLIGIDTFLVSYCNDEEHREELDKVIKNKIKSLCAEYGITEIGRILINPTGKFEIGGSFGDAGLTGRKIVVDAYQGFANVGGGCMNGKDPTKVDLTGAHKARQIACELLKKHNLKWCEVQLSYSIGLERPMAIYVDSDKGNIEVGEELYESCTPRKMIEDLSMKTKNYEQLAKFGHFNCFEE